MGRAPRTRRSVWEKLERRRMLAAHINGGPTAFATIQAAVDAALAGSVITVDAGTYGEQVYVDKTLTIRGAQSGIDGRSNRRVGAAESLVNGALNGDGTRTSAFYIDANNVTLDGFLVQGQTNQGDAGAGIVIAPNRNGTHILNNIVQNNVAGLFISNNSASNALVVQYNLFRGNNNTGSNGGRGIYTNGGISGGLLTNVLIDSNAFINNRGTGGTTGLEGAIALESLRGGSQTNITITNNIIDSNGKAVLFFNVDNALISGNTVTNTLDKYSGSLRFEGNNHNITIQNNNVFDNTGPGVAIDSKGVSGDNYGFVVTNNNFYFNSLGYGSRYSVVSDGSAYVGTLDVRNNWWGDASGPGGDGAGTGDKVYGIGHVVSGNQWFVATGGTELFSPWSTSLIGSGRTAYFGALSSDGAAIQFEDFDHGGEGIGYHDTTAGNSGGKYRTAERVDIETSTDAGGGFDIYNIVAGEWLGYMVGVAQGGTFNLDVRVATAQTSGGKFHVEIDGVNLSGTMTVPATGGSQAWRTISVGGLNLTAGQHYLRFVFDANGSNGTVGNFNYFTLTNAAPVQLPATPTNLAAAVSGFAAVNLTWNDNAVDETGYVVERSIGSGAWQGIATLGAGAVSYTDSSVLSQTTYSYRVRATGIAGDSGNSNVATVTTPVAANVTYLSDLPFFGTPISGWGTVQRDLSVAGLPLTLNGVTYAKGLGVHAISDVSFNLSGGGYKSFLADVGIDDKQLYDGSVVFQVFADGAKIYDSGVMGPDSATQHINVDISGVSTLRLYVGDGGDGIDFDHADWADARVTIASIGPSAPAAPSGLAASAASATLVNLTWGNVANETGYRVLRSIDNVSFTQIGTTAADVTSYGDTTVAGGTSYYYLVKAFNAVGDSLGSNVASVVTPAAPTAPAAPSGLTATAVSQTQIDLTWADNSSNETGFVVERSLDGVTFAQIATPGANAMSFSDVGLTAGTKYYYRVGAVNAVGPSANSNVASATTLTVPTVPAAPSGLVASAVSSTQINLTWADNSGDETGFVVERSIDGVSFTQIATPGANATSYASSGLSASTTYWYRVRAVNAVGPSGNSNVASATTLVAPTPLPGGWTSRDIGAVGVAGSAGYTGGTYTLTGAGAGIGGRADAFNFAYQTLGGSGTIVARVASSTGGAAGIMLREGTAAGARMAALVVNADGSVSFITRTSTGGVASIVTVAPVAGPQWLKLVRSGKNIVAYRSSDGVSWSQVGSKPMGKGIIFNAGLAVSSNSTSTTSTAKFDNVSIV